MPTVPRPEYSPALKEIAGRLAKLSYRDMTQLAGLVTNHLSAPLDPQTVVRALLSSSDILGAA